jgi:hypothetical protein
VGGRVRETVEGDDPGGGNMEASLHRWRKVAAASELSAPRDGQLALETIPGTKSPADELSRKRPFFEATLQHTILPVDTHSIKARICPKPHQNLQTKPNPEQPALQKTRDVQQNASTSSSKYQTKIFSHPFHKPYSPSHQSLQTKTNSRTTSCTENTRHATKRVPYLLATSDEEIIAPLP